MPTLFALQQVAVPKGAESLGLALDQNTHVITSVVPGSVAQRHGITTGDILVGVDSAIVTNFSHQPGPMEGTMMIAEVEAIMNATTAFADAQGYVTLHVLKAIDEIDVEVNEAPPPTAAIPDATFSPASQFIGARPGWDFKEGEKGLGYYKQGVSSAMSMSMTTPAVEPRRPLQEQSAPRAPQKLQRPPQPPQQMGWSSAYTSKDALSMYPWATTFHDADGKSKNWYNMPNGTTLQPMVSLKEKQLEVLKRKEALVAAVRPGTASYNALGNSQR
mmetsp:Transcript_17582/g.45121  ORF Transcript_17582/g.45121 Transcript_17582/m.45121 type:complete len:274 (-) Transcript_17582:300-1121(-)